METTFPRLLLQHAAQRPADPAMREKEYGIWQTHSWAGMAKMVEQVACGLYQDAAAPECVFPINNAEVRFAFAEDQEQVDKLLEIREKCPRLAAIYYDD